jgi:hypothetical protein
MKKLIFRMSRGTALCNFTDIEETLWLDGKPMEKTAYVIVFQEGIYMRQKLVKVCESFIGNIFTMPKSNFTEKIAEVARSIEDANNALNLTRQNISQYLKSINVIDEKTDISGIMIYKWFLKKEIALYNVLNYLGFSKDLQQPFRTKTKKSETSWASN